MKKPIRTNLVPKKSRELKVLRTFQEMSVCPDHDKTGWEAGRSSMRGDGEVKCSLLASSFEDMPKSWGLDIECSGAKYYLFSWSSQKKGWLLRWKSGSASNVLRVGLKCSGIFVADFALYCFKQSQIYSETRACNRWTHRKCDQCKTNVPC